MTWLYQSCLKMPVYLKNIFSPLEHRGQKFRHAFCHKATVRRIVFKAELTFSPCALMENLFYFNKKPENSNRRGIFIVLSGFISVLFFISPAFSQPTDSSKDSNTVSARIYSRHWDDFPVHESEQKVKNILLFHDLFVLSFNPETRFPDWIAYQLSPSVVWGFLQEDRSWKSDPLLPSFLSLSPKDYKGASRWGYDRGHLAPKGSFKGSVFAYQAQYVTNLVPQKRNLNQGPWRMLEETIRRVVLRGHSVKILAGPLYGNKALPVWPSAQGRLRQIPSGYWKIVSMKNKGILNICAFIMPQEISSRKAALKKYKVKETEIEKHSQLLLFENYKGRRKEGCKFLL